MTGEVRCWCQHCRKELPPSHTGPCPHCGKTGKDCRVTVRATIGLAASLSAQKAHKYTKRHPRFIAVSIALTVVALVLGYLLGGFVGLLIGMIVAILNWWLTPYTMETVVEITSWGDKRRGMQEAKVENNTQQQEEYSHKDIYSKLEDIEKKVDSSSRTQKSVFLYAIGAAFVILGLSYWPGLLERIGMDTATFYLTNSLGLIVLGFIAIISAIVFQRAQKK